jgi:hypothetical protein
MLDERLKESLGEIHKMLLQRGSLLSRERLAECFSLFRSRFGPERLSSLDGETLLNTIHGRGENDSLVYWLEFKNDPEFPTRAFGSIAGGNALKFGIYKTRETGEWMTGHATNPTKLSISEAINIARKHRDQLVGAVAALQKLPTGADDEAYQALQKELNKIAPDVCDVAWGHKYLYLLFPEKMDDYHVADYQRHHLLKLLLLPASHTGLFACAGQFVRVANDLGWPIDHLTSVLNERDGSPIKYWRLGTKLGEGPDAQDVWSDMKAGGYAAIGWAELDDLSSHLEEDDAKEKITALLMEKYTDYNPSTASRKAGEIRNFANGISEGDVVLAADGTRIRGVGVVQGPYQYELTGPKDAPHRRKVEWHDCADWKTPVTEGLRTTVCRLKDDNRTLIEAEKRLLEPSLKITIQNPLTNPGPGSKNLPAALNTILYGPPGTGKTYRLRNHYMELFTDRQAAPTPEEQGSALVKDLAWWEAIALVLLDTKTNQASVAQILEHPLVHARLKLSANKNPRAMIWASLQSHTKRDCPNVNYTTRIEPLIFTKDAASLWSVDAQLAKAEVPHLTKILHNFRNPPQEVPTVCRYKFTTFHQSLSYEDFVEGIKPQTEEAPDRSDGQISYEVTLGIFRELCREAQGNPTKNYALFVDEINRGNVASIFGELITLIEEDKRLGKENELKTILPYSRDEFGVPGNLYIIGTMNTADRSVEALDTALRRRFTFEEMRPDAAMIEQPDELEVDLRKLFETINGRIEQLLDHDHCMGHYYFMGIETLADLKSRFANRIIPLLREYFYGNPAKIGMVLGKTFITPKTTKRTFAPGTWGTDELDEKEVFTFADVAGLTEGDFQAVYAENRTGI